MTCTRRARSSAILSASSGLLSGGRLDAAAMSTKTKGRRLVPSRRSACSPGRRHRRPLSASRARRVGAGFVGYVALRPLRHGAVAGRREGLRDPPRIEDHRRRPPGGRVAIATARRGRVAFRVRRSRRSSTCPPPTCSIRARSISRSTSWAAPGPEFSSTTVRGVFGVLPRHRGRRQLRRAFSPGPVGPDRAPSTSSGSPGARRPRIHRRRRSASSFCEAARTAIPPGSGYGYASYQLPSSARG